MIEDLSFSPRDKDVLVSVSDDKNIIFWDLRVSTSKNYNIFVKYKFWYKYYNNLIKLKGLHNDDINCVDWNVLNENYIATGSSDGTANIIDIRTRKSLH